MAPPRMAPGQRGGSPYPARGNTPQQHGGPPRGRGGGRGGGVGVTGPQGGPSASISSAVQPVGVRRPGFGTAGRQITVAVNACEMNIPDITVYHYDAMEKSLRAAFNLKLIVALQKQYPDVFIKAAVYDGKKNLYTSYRLNFGTEHHRQFNVAWTEGTRISNFKITITEAREIDLEYTAAQQSWDENVSTALTALNIVLRMEPSLNHPFRVRSFYSDKVKAPLANMPLEVWQGYFQSVRPALGRLLVTIDVSAGVMFKPGPLVETCVEFFGGNRKDNPDRYLRAQAIPPLQRRRLQNFLFGVKVEAESAAGVKKLVTIHKLTERDAASTIFTPTGGKQTTVAQYFAQAENKRLRLPNIICMQTAKGAVIPLERCTIVPGQLSRAELTPDATRAMVEFATKKPDQQLNAIRAGIQTLSYGQSQYVRDFGLHIDTNSLPMGAPARVLNPPDLKYGTGSKQPSIRPKEGTWNLVDKKFFKPMPLGHWMVVVFMQPNRFSPDDAKTAIRGLIQGCEAVGMPVQEKQPLFVYKNPQSNIDQAIVDAVKQNRDERKATPTFIYVQSSLPGLGVLLTGHTISSCGDMKRGVANQCLRVGKCRNARPQYWANVALKINAKLGGVNVIPDPKSAPIISDPRQPTIVMGADVMHPAPGSQSPSYAAVVGNIDSDGARYIAKTTLQLGRKEMIEDLRSMAKDILTSYMGYRANVEKVTTPPKRLIFFRGKSSNGVSEGEFKRVLDLELPELQAACADAKISPPPKITFIVVGKRHHTKLTPKDGKERDPKSGNLPAGTVVDQAITNPIEFDFFLLSHAGLIGTSKSSHYSVVHDDFGFDPNAIQALAYTLCFTYARATRSVSIPTPVYYAHIVCKRAKTHYDPQAAPLSIMSGGSQTREETLAQHQGQYQGVHNVQAKRMYFM
ncbi:argonaute-like protein [Desarmillaria tabescens]|uniref:Argonaute-like protein n=1 Tax=Armillaria tabescens TaxID=1929756 RepID=A0AA39MT69_ARMTA|nr:argonaute-like protein [Desarmillaria tabescens]KAK0445338.1 argonaute-like protein [Desarmillaria tabescens]